jgi:diacylglycerol kinase family enzyme
VVYNPATGLDRRQIVKTSLREMGLEFEFEETTVQRNAEHIIASTPDMTAYKLVVVVGGDGTIHQAVNGLVRKGSIVPPVLLVPNGSGNDTCRSLGILSVEQALEILKK